MLPRQEEIGLMLDMMTTDGWRLLVQELEDNVTDLKESIVYGVNSIDEINVLRGKLNTTETIARYQDILQQELQMIDHNQTL